MFAMLTERRLRWLGHVRLYGQRAVSPQGLTVESVGLCYTLHRSSLSEVQGHARGTFTQHTSTLRIASLHQTVFKVRRMKPAGHALQPQTFTVNRQGEGGGSAADWACNREAGSNTKSLAFRVQSAFIPRQCQTL